MARNHDLLERAPAHHELQSFAEAAMEPLIRLRGEVDRLFGDIPGRWPSTRLLMPTGLLIPAVEMTETKKLYKLSVEVPGMDAADIEMHVHDGAIFISGEKKERRDEDEKSYSHFERSYGTFERRIELPRATDEKGIKAKVRNGVLEIRVPKKSDAEVKRQRIAIERA